MQVSDGKNKFTVKEFFKSLSIQHIVEYHGRSMGSNFSVLEHWILKKLCCHFIQDFQCSELGEEIKELKEQFMVLAEQCSFD